jgi:hypothetical protein
MSDIKTITMAYKRIDGQINSVEVIPYADFAELEAECRFAMEKLKEILEALNMYGVSHDRATAWLASHTKEQP